MAEKINSVSSNSKDGPRKCTECKIHFPNIYDYVAHLESIEHKKGVMKNKYGAKYLEAKANLLGQKLDKHLEEENDKSGSSDDEDDVYPCEICEKVCTGVVNFRLHMSGKKHRKNVNKGKILEKMKKERIIPGDDSSAKDDSLLDVIFTKDEFGSSEYVCKICNKKCPGPEALKQHKESERHIKMLEAQKHLKDTFLKSTEGSSDSDDSASISCDICAKTFSGPLPYQHHLQSSSHLKQIQDAEKMEKFKDLIISNDDDRRKLKCKICNKCFSGPKPFKDHLKSSLHSKLQKKNELLKIIEEKYPEIIISTNLDTENADDGDNMLLCSVCHTAFTGPESALDHGKSQKHGKAMKKKSRLEQLKVVKNRKQPHVMSKSKPDSDKLSNEADNSSNDWPDDFDIIG